MNTLPLSLQPQRILADSASSFVRQLTVKYVFEQELPSEPRQNAPHLTEERVGGCS